MPSSSCLGTHARNAKCVRVNEWGAWPGCQRTNFLQCGEVNRLQVCADHFDAAADFVDESQIKTFSWFGSHSNYFEIAADLASPRKVSRTITPWESLLHRDARCKHARFAGKVDGEVACGEEVDTGKGGGDLTPSDGGLSFG